MAYFSKLKMLLRNWAVLPGLTLLAFSVFGIPTLLRGQLLNPLSVNLTPAPPMVETTASIPLPPLEGRPNIIGGITRLAALHTDRPERPRFDIYRYTVKKGETPWSIADQFDLTIESVLWGNEGMSADAGGLQPDREINILPVNGVLHTVAAGDTLNRLQLLHGISIEVIQEYFGNDLDGIAPEADLPVGQKIIVPGGRNPVVWQEPGPIVVPGKGRYSPGFYTGPLVYTGSGYFAWPVSSIVITQGYWGGYPAIDIDTYPRQPIFASDSGTVIYSAWSDTGYGNLVIIDHGNGYWTYYAHNTANLVSVGQGVLQGQQITESGSTGNSTGDHLDFRIRTASGSFLNPGDFLP
ncbi:MAG: peptidoglycan DD-metalloendopeptidase family protein [Bellilinea sp.]